MKIYKIWIVKNSIFVKERSCVEKKQTYLVDDFYYVNKNELDTLHDSGEYMYSLTYNEETINLFRKLLKEKYDEKLKQVQEKITNLENANIVNYKY